VGVFDGLHRGHQRLLRRVMKIAQRDNWRPAIITFNDHPQSTLEPQKRPPRLMPAELQMAHLENAGIAEAFVVPFTPQLAEMPAEEFVADLLLRNLRMRHIVVGEDFVFGAGAAGDIGLLRRLGVKWDFGVTIIRPVRSDGSVISSTGIRLKISSGDIAAANRWLGYAYALHGTVVHGAHRGRRFGLPTANLYPEHELIPVDGIYAVTLELRGQTRLALCHIGRRPTFESSELSTIEVHIPGWRGNLYRRRLSLSFIARLRPVAFFSDPQKLIQQIVLDWEAAKAMKPRGVLAPSECFPGQGQSGKK
jgi:riboflavin kinase/FMN adenylyltransferase